MFVYLTSKRYPATTADHLYIRSLAHAFADRLGDDFLLVIAGAVTEDLRGIPTYGVGASARLRSFFYFFWFPLFAYRKKLLGRDSTFFANDFNLLVIALLWRPILRARYNVVSDWHLMTETWKDKYVASRSQALITTSARLRDHILALVPEAASRAHVVYGAVDPALYAGALPPRSSLGLPDDKRLVGYVGGFRTMGKDKGITTMIDALEYLAQEVVMVFVGGSAEEMRVYKKYAEQRGISARCVWIERQSVERAADYERSMDVLAIPYPDEPHFRNYGFPMKVWEYLAAGKPIVYSDLAILREVLENRGTAFMPGNAESLARALQHSLELPVDSESLRRVALQHSWNAKADEIRSILL